MIAYTAQQDPRLQVPNAFSASQAFLSVFFRPVPITSQNWDAPTSNALTPGSENRSMGFRRYTEEDLRMFAEEDELTPELAERFKDLLED